jgi:hypothetical protein
MPTEINNSPLTLDPATIISLGIKKSQGQAKALQDYAKKTRQDLGVEEGQKGLFGGVLKSDEFKDLSFGKKLGILGKGVGEYFVGGLEGVGGSDMLKDSTEPEQPKYTTNINPMTGEEDNLKNRYGDPSPLPMTGKPLKMLTGVNSPMTYKMSAAQYKSAVKMSEISGASTLPSALTLKGDQYKIDANKDGEITGEDFKLLKNK